MAFIFQARYIAQCDWESRDGEHGCVITETFNCDIDGTGKRPQLVRDAAEAAARRYFTDAGWDLSDDNCRCPQCKDRR